VGVGILERRLEKIMRGIVTFVLVLTMTGCIESTPDVAISEPDPELNFVRGYRSSSDDCQFVGETSFTVDFIDDAADLVACPTGSAAMASLVVETGAPVITQTNSFSFFSIPYR
jgi:hypothetical protein